MKTLSSAGCRRAAAFCACACTVLLSCALQGCSKLKPADVRPLYSAGMGYDAVNQLKQMDITPAEVADVAQARQAGFSDSACVQVMQVQRTRKLSFDMGTSIADLLRAGVSEGLVLNLERMNELGLETGEIAAMRLAGLSEDILLTVAQRRVAHEPVLSGPSLAEMKNLGMRSSTLLELAQHGVSDDQARAIMAKRRRGATDAEILREFAGE